MWRLFAEYGHGNRRWFGVGLLTSVAARGLQLVPPVVLGAAIDGVFGAEPYGLPLVPASLLPQGEAAQFWFSATLMAVAMALAAAANFVRQSTMNLFSHRVKHEVRTACYRKMQRLDMAFFDEHRTGELMSVLNNDTNRLELFLDNMMGAAIQLGVLIVGIGGVLLWINPRLALVTLAVIPVAAVFTWWFMRLVESAYADIRSSVGDLNTRLENNLAGIEVIKTAGTEEYEDDRVEDVSYTYFQRDWRSLRLNFVYRPGLQLLTSFAFVATFVVGGLWVLGAPLPLFPGEVSVGQLVTFLLLAQRMTEPLAQMSEIVDRYEDAKASATRILGLMNVPIAVGDPEDAVDLDPDRVRGHVEYDDVSFGYEDGEAPRASDSGAPRALDSEAPHTQDGGTSRAQDSGAPRAQDSGTSRASNYVLEGIDFEIEPGQTVGLVGPTGAGKSTTLKLLVRLYDVSEGAIRVDGHDVRDVTLDSLRSAMGYVSQDTFLFDGTVRENIRYGSFDASDAEVEEAARMAEAHEFVSELPEGYDTRVGERGVKLSGGQRQRVSIARVMLRDPAILVLDEATSDVDTETEMLIQRSIDRISADRTAFVIAHRLSTVREADRILVLENGRVVEDGTHERLLAEDGLYANLWSVQAGEIDELPEEFVERASRRAAERTMGGLEEGESD
ncbi:multidrug ABC transporter ATP-binding protein [Halobacteriales archaeon SW_7_71_33]|nr:MAG: multidrug ABC transporter ATP-binding protein [Halobacteriales archaeon SW_7_71_33]